ncbi:hypothetical protein OESDEN_16780 [Oesophagostomum dentatum]|uniref:Uncharacterized protein n=1 Tax=Oesophagostomum dentatum TaxID=61180 RepID=A0A0B1SHZ8_OESDE|nr:hypothetical protein OESDEN_16780 [Oesophagostomum dentatum]
MVMKKYRETERDIAEAKSLFTPEYFKESKFSAPDIPPWKRDLLAKRYSQEKLALFEENAWKEFAEWKKLNAPSVNVNPPSQYYHFDL